MLDGMANRVELIMDPDETALGHHDIDNVAGYHLEVERVDDGESRNRQDFELECDSGGTRDWCERLPLDGNGPGGDVGAELDTSGSRSAT